MGSVGRMTSWKAWHVCGEHRLSNRCLVVWMSVWKYGDMKIICLGYAEYEGRKRRMSNRRTITVGKLKNKSSAQSGSLVAVGQRKRHRPSRTFQRQMPLINSISPSRAYGHPHRQGRPSATWRRNCDATGLHSLLH